MRKLVIALVVALACLSIGAVSALAAHKFRTRVTIHFVEGTTPYGADKFKGKVKSKKAKCERRRKVTVKRVQPGPDQVIGVDRSDGSGRWKVVVAGSAPSGQYFAVAKKRTLKSGAVCKKGKSDTVAVP